MLVICAADIRESSKANRGEEIDGESCVFWIVTWKQALKRQRKEPRERRNRKSEIATTAWFPVAMTTYGSLSLSFNLAMPINSASSWNRIFTKIRLVGERTHTQSMMYPGSQYTQDCVSA